MNYSIEEQDAMTDQGFGPTGPSDDEILMAELRQEEYIDLVYILRNLEATRTAITLRRTIIELATDDEKRKLIESFKEAE